MWIAESIRYKSGQEQWFNEGISEFYAIKTAVELGLITPDKALSIAALPIGYYLASEGLGQLSMRAAGIDDKTKFDNYFLVYHGGWVVAMILDHDIRMRTKGEKSLDALMTWMNKNHPRHQRLYSLADIILGLKQTTDIDYSEFLAKYVDGTQTIPVAEHFPLSDALWEYMSNGPKKSQYKYLYQTIGVEHANL